MEEGLAAAATDVADRVLKMTTTPRVLLVSITWAVSFMVGCHSGGVSLEGLARVNSHDRGPEVVWDLFAEPIPEIPFPNDVATRSDPTSATGRRVNISLHASTQHERRLRRLIDHLDGFGTFAPMWVRFDDRIDVADLWARQNDDDVANDPVMVINIDPHSANYGKRVEIDLGPGPNDAGKTRFPILLENNAHYFDNDPHHGASNLLFETHVEDRDGDGMLDYTEDLDDDGVLDVPNTWGTFLADDYAHLQTLINAVEPLGIPPEKAQTYFDLITGYELETDTLIMQPVVPLDEATRYAIVLTRDIVGQQTSSPIRSPFEWVNHTQQSKDLQPLIGDNILATWGIEAEDLAFVWSFTTQSVTTELEAIRAGLYGEGPLSHLQRQYSDELSVVSAVDLPEQSDNPFILKTERFVGLLSASLVRDAIGLPEQSVEAISAQYRQYVDYFVFADYDSPMFIDNADGVFSLDLGSGTGDYSRGNVHLTCAVPKAHSGHVAPFPVALYCNGTGSWRFEVVVRAAALAERGIATCGIDAYGHGLPGILADLLGPTLDDYGLSAFKDVMFSGRARDLNDDGFTDSGGDFWTFDTFHTRDAVRQTVTDYFQLVRILRNFGEGNMPIDANGDGNMEIAGDFNADGVADIGGEQSYFAFGQSLGGIVSALLGPTEPSVVATAPISGGGGMSQLAARSVQSGISEAVYLPLLGPLIIATPRSNGRVDLMLDVADVTHERLVPIALFPSALENPEAALEHGDRILLENLDNGEVAEVRIREVVGEAPGRFRIQVAADAGDRLRLKFYDKDNGREYRVIDSFEEEGETFYGTHYSTGDSLVALTDGLGLRRQSPGLRRMIAIAQMTLEAGDPINYAKHYSRPYLQRPEGRVPTNLLMMNTVGDMNVPVSTAVAMGRAAGLLPDVIDQRFGKSTEQILLDTWTVEGLEHLRRFTIDGCYQNPGAVLFDVDDVSNGVFSAIPPRLAAPNMHSDCQPGNEPFPDFCQTTCDPLPPLRLSRSEAWGTSALRFIYISQRGRHGFTWPNVNLGFDPALFGINQIANFFASGGRVVDDTQCLGSHTAPCAP